MWTFAGLVLVAGVLGYWLRKLYRVQAATGAVIETALNRAATRNGHDPLTTPEDVPDFLR